MAHPAYRPPALSPVEPDRLYEVTTATASFYATHLAGHEPALDYLTSRGINHPEVSTFWRLGYAPGWRSLVNHLRGKGFPEEELYAAGVATIGRHGQLLDRFHHRLVFPIHDHTGRTVGFTGRDVSGDPDAPKWLNTPETRLYAKSRLLYGLGPQLQQRPPDGDRPPLVLVVEGAADALAAWRMSRSVSTLPGGIPIYAVAPCGTTLTGEQLQLLRDTLPGARLAVALDGDPAGRRGFLRAHPLLRTWPSRPYAITLPPGSDPADLLTEHGPADALAKLATRMAPANRTALVYTLDQLVADGRIPQPLAHLDDRLNVGRTVLDYFVDDPRDVPQLAQVAADRLGLTSEEVIQLAVAQVPVAAYLDPYATPAEVDEYVARYLIEPTDADVRFAAAHPEPPADTRQQPEPDPASDHNGQPTPPGLEPGGDTEPANIEAEELPAVVTATHASHHGRWPVTDATSHSFDHKTGRFAWALAGGIGERQAARTAAETAARIATRTAARGTPAAGIAAAGAAVDADPAAGTEDAAITVATAHPADGGSTRFDLAWAGNIRAYTLLGDQVVQVTTDHTAAQQRRDAGQTVAANSQLHHLLTASVRNGPVGRTSITLPPGGALLLATPGAYQHLDRTMITQALGPVADPQVTVNRLLHHAPTGDNATVMLLRAPAQPTTGPGQPARLARLASSATPPSHTTQAPPPQPGRATTDLIAHLRSQLAARQQTRNGARR